MWTSNNSLPTTFPLNAKILKCSNYNYDFRIYHDYTIISEFQVCNESSTQDILCYTLI